MSAPDQRTDRKDRSREKILESAGCLVRERGIAGTSVADVMSGAGMTVGGFYAHFPSKQALVEETLRESLCRSRENMRAAGAGKKGSDAVQAMARSYLSRSHRDNPELGCPLPATAGEIAAADDRVREVLAEELDVEIVEMASHLDEAGVKAPRSEAIAAIAMMVGGLTLARALSGTDLSDEVLKSCRDHIKHNLQK
jgi:TetR/AcrR family transcriptional regulator, transcriptional repressor for nem operon